MIRLVSPCLLAFVLMKQICMGQAIGADSLPNELRERLTLMPKDVKIGIAVLDESGAPVFRFGGAAVMPVASAIKPAILLELFARYSQTLSFSPAEAAMILTDPTHPAFVHFSDATKKEIVADLSDATIKRLGWIMIDKRDEVGRKYSSASYNGATNLAIALLGGPTETTRAIHAREASFHGMTVNRYMLADRMITGDNTSTPQALASLHHKISSRQLANLTVEVRDEIDRILHTRDFPDGTKLHSKGGSLHSDPVTRVQAGSFQAGQHTMNFSIMCSQPLHSSESGNSQYSVLADLAKSTYVDLKSAFLDR